MNYRNAPIAESVIDFRVRFREEPNFSALQKSARQFSTVFPKIEINRQTAIKVPLRADAKSANVEHKQVGFVLRSSDPPRVLQFQQGGFAYSHLAPYTSWKQFVPEAKRYWAAYIADLGPETVTRCAIRTINRVIVPESRFPIEKYFRVFPQTPDDLGPGASAFALQVVVPQPKIGEGAEVIINLGVGERESFDSSPIILDIDLFVLTNVEARSDEIWSVLESLHSRKNDIFESCITDDTRKLIA